jgi:hypothetical protein
MKVFNFTAKKNVQILQKQFDLFVLHNVNSYNIHAVLLVLESESENHGPTYNVYRFHNILECT